MSSSSSFSFYPELSTTALSAAGNSGLPDPHDTIRELLSREGDRRGHRGTSLCSERPLPQTTPPGPASHPGTAEAADEFFLIIVLWRICAEMRKRLETWGQTYAASIFEKETVMPHDIPLSITSFRNKGCVNSKETVKHESRKTFTMNKSCEISQLTFWEKSCLTGRFCHASGTVWKHKDYKNINAGQVPLEGYPVYEIQRLSLCYDLASELNETTRHPYWCRVHSYLTYWNNHNKEKWNLISGNEKS